MTPEKTGSDFFWINYKKDTDWLKNKPYFRRWHFFCRQLYVCIFFSSAG